MPGHARVRLRPWLECPGALRKTARLGEERRERWAHALRRRKAASTLTTRLAAGSALVLTLLLAGGGRAGADEHGGVLRFLGGAALGLGIHELGHVTASLCFDGRPSLRRVDFAGIPFVAITHRELPPRSEFIVASAGFWAQHASSEWVLTRQPDLRSRSGPVAKGVLAFGVLASTAYAAAAIAQAGPSERDTRAMAASLGVAEPVVGGLVLAPALLDAYRYHRPEADWARWASRGVKIGLVLLVLRADHLDD